MEKIIPSFCYNKTFWIHGKGLQVGEHHLSGSKKKEEEKNKNKSSLGFLSRSRHIIRNLFCEIEKRNKIIIERDAERKKKKER